MGSAQSSSNSTLNTDITGSGAIDGSKPLLSSSPLSSVTIEHNETNTDEINIVNNSHGSANSTNKAKSTSSKSINDIDPNRPAGGMPLVNYVCRKKKKTYDKCVSSWYNDQFLTGTGSLNQEEVCGPKFDIYRTCVLKGIKKEIWDKQNLPPPKEGSPLAEVIDVVDESDDNTH